MKKFLKILAGIVFVFLVGLYLTFLFVLPNVLDLNKYKPEIQKLAKEHGDVDLNIQNLRLITKPNLQAGFETGNISVILPDNTVFLNAGNVNVNVSLAQLLLLKVKVFAFVQDPNVDFDIVDGEQFRIVSHIENLLNKNKGHFEEIQDNAKTSKAVSLPINPEWIKVFAKVRLNNYKILVNDIKSSHNLKLEGEAFDLGYFNNKKIKIKTNASLLSDEENVVNAKLNIDSFLPPFETADKEEDEAVEVKIPFVNPVLVYRDYNVRCNIDSKLKIREKDGIIKSWGYFNLENLTANLSGLQLPESYIKFASRGANINLDSNLNFAKNQNFSVIGKLNYLKPNMDLSFTSEKIYFHDVIILAKAILDTLRIKNDFDFLKGEGFFLANANIKTDFKKLKSSGMFLVNNGKIASEKLGLVLDKMNINVNLDDNVLSIPNSSADINGRTFNIKGEIDEKTHTDIDISIEKLPLVQLYKAFAPSDLKKQFDLMSGDLTLKLKINGKLKDAIANLRINLSNFSMSDVAKTFILRNKNTDIEFFNNFKAGLIKNNDLEVYIPMSKSLISIPIVSITLDRLRVEIPKAILKINDNSKLIFSGDIQNYLSKPDINFVSMGDVYAVDLRKFIGSDFESFVDAKGKLPLEFVLNGNDKRQTIDLSIFANADNYITPLHISDIVGEETVLKSVVRIRNNRIKIKDTGLFKRVKTVDEEGVENINFEPVISVEGTIVGDYINRINVNIAKELNSVIYAFRDSSLKVAPSRIQIFGEMIAPKMRGNLSITNLSIPQLFTVLKTASAEFKDTFLNFNLSDLVMNGSDMNIDGKISLIPSTKLEISDLKINSKFLDADKIMKVSEAAMAILPQSDSNAAPADIPVIIENGSINFKKIKSGEIKLYNTTSKIRLRNNVFFINRLLTHMCDGRVTGRIAMNLLDGFMKIQVNGQALNTEKLLLEAAAMKDTLSGTTSFETNISLSGSTYEEQMRSLAGRVNFTVKNGQFGPFGRLENMILAENIRESEIFQSTIGEILAPLVTIDTTHFSTLDGYLTFKDGVVTIEPITSVGNILALNIFGNFNLLTNIVDMKVRSRLASMVSDMLGPIALVNPVNLVKNTPGLNLVLAKTFPFFCEVVTLDEMDAIPDFVEKHSDLNSTKFQIVLRGDVNKPLTLVKSFKWLSVQDDIDKAQNFAKEYELQIQEEMLNAQKKGGRKN